VLFYVAAKIDELLESQNKGISVNVSDEKSLLLKEVSTK
jgi:hypothetical protein